MSINKVKLFWFSKIRLQNIDISNFGDDINPLLIERITNKNVVWVDPKSQNILQKYFTRINFAIGSILHFATDNSDVWGSGLIDSKSSFPKKATYHAVRGLYTYNKLKNSGCKVNPIFGDPALLLPKYFKPSISKKYKLGIIPHYIEYEQILKNIPKNDELLIIDLKKDPLSVIDDITACEKIISSSLHGIIVGMAYEIPSIRVTFTNKIFGDGIKYQDFFESVGIRNAMKVHIDSKKFSITDILTLFDNNEKQTYIQNDLIKLQDDLLANRPF